MTYEQILEALASARAANDANAVNELEAYLNQQENKQLVGSYTVPGPELDALRRAQTELNALSPEGGYEFGKATGDMLSVFDGLGNYITPQNMLATGAGGLAAAEAYNATKNSIAKSNEQFRKDKLLNTAQEAGSDKIKQFDIEDFKKKLAAEGINYDDLKKHPGTMKQKLQTHYSNALQNKYGGFFRNTLTAKTIAGHPNPDKQAGGSRFPGLKRAASVAGKTALGVAAGVPATVEMYNAVSSVGGAEEAKKAYKEAQQKVDAFDRDYRRAQMTDIGIKLQESELTPQQVERLKRVQAELQRQGY